jgi:membrane-bound serine protease (ClpP class)
MPDAPSVSLTAAWALLLGGLVLIGAEFFLPTVVVGFLGALISFAGIYFSAAYGSPKCILFCVIFCVGLGFEFWAFRRFVMSTKVGQAMTNQTQNVGAAVAELSHFIGKTAQAKTVLAPSGKIELDGTILEAFSLDGYVDRGAKVIITEAAAGRVTVRIVR